MEVAGFLAIALALLGFAVETTVVTVVTLGVAGVSLVIVVRVLWSRWRPATKGWSALALVLACAGAGVFAYLIEVRGWS